MDPKQSACRLRYWWWDDIDSIRSLLGLFMYPMNNREGRAKNLVDDDDGFAWLPRTQIFIWVCVFFRHVNQHALNLARALVRWEWCTHHTYHSHSHSAHTHNHIHIYRGHAQQNHACFVYLYGWNIDLNDQSRLLWGVVDVWRGAWILHVELRASSFCKNPTPDLEHSGTNTDTMNVCTRRANRDVITVRRKTITNWMMTTRKATKRRAGYRFRTRVTIYNGWNFEHHGTSVFTRVQSLHKYVDNRFEIREH